MTESESCKLCLGPGPISRSHIIPEFFYADSYDEKHRYLEMQRDTGGKSTRQKGKREPLLCEECEGKLNRQIEQPFSEMWYQEAPLPQICTESVLSFSNPNPAIFHALLISILWRSSVSSLDFFSSVSLGPYEERMRLALLNNRTDEFGKYPIFGSIITFPGTNEIAKGIISSPFEWRVQGAKAYQIIFGGCAWIVVVDSHKPQLAPGFELPVSGVCNFLVLAIDKLPGVRGSIRKHFEARLKQQK